MPELSVAQRRGAKAVSVETHLTMEDKKKTTIESIKLRDLYVDLTFQRPLDNNRITKMAEEFDPDGLGYPLVAEIKQKGGPGKFAIIDGQHRIRAVEKAFQDPDQELECQVIRGITIERAAALFLVRNQSARPNALSRFLAAWRKGDPEAKEVNKIVHAEGLEIATGRADGVVQAVSALLRIYRGNRKSPGPQNYPLPLKRTLVACKEAWGKGPDSFNGDVMYGIGLFMLKYGDRIEMAELIRKLQLHPGGPMNLLGGARALKQVYGGTTAVALASAVTNIYNRGKKKGVLPGWTTTTKEIE